MLPRTYSLGWLRSFMSALQTKSISGSILRWTGAPPDAAAKISSDVGSWYFGTTSQYNMHSFFSCLSSELIQNRITCIRMRGMGSPPNMARMAALRACFLTYCRILVVVSFCCAAPKGKKNNINDNKRTQDNEHHTHTREESTRKEERERKRRSENTPKQPGHFGR